MCPHCRRVVSHYSYAFFATHKSVACLQDKITALESEIGRTKKHLALYPNIVLKCNDLGPKTEGKSEFRLFIGGVLGNQGQTIKSDQIEALGVHRALILWEEAQTTTDKQVRDKYSKEHLKRCPDLKVRYMAKEYTALTESFTN